jgi:hypothetical protein
MKGPEQIQPGKESEILLLEQREADAMLRGDVAALESLWDDGLLVNSTANLIAGKQVLLDLIRSGRLRLKTYKRRTLRVHAEGDLCVTTGSESSQLLDHGVADQLLCSYMNYWIRREGRWRLLARHVGLMARRKPEA